MKISSFITLIIILLFSCGTDEYKIQKAWIGKYEVQYSGAQGEQISKTALRQIIQFDQDSLVIKRFPFNFFNGESSKRTSQAYKILDNQILTAQDTFNIQNVFSDGLIISFDSEYTKRIVYEELVRYNQAERANELIDFLISNTFTTQKDTTIMEFRKNWSYVSPSFNFGAGSNQSWMIDTFENELFLVFDGSYGAAIQIKDFNNNQVVGKIYYKDNIEVIWNKFENEKGFEISQIIGEWERIQEPMPQPPIGDGKKYYDKEFLRITRNEIIRYEGFRRDSISWEFNRGKNIIILPDYDTVRNRLGRQWNIKSIESDTLTLERKGRLVGTRNSNIEMSKFKRKNE